MITSNGLGCAECGGGCGSPSPSKFVEEGLAGLDGFLEGLGDCGTAPPSTPFAQWLVWYTCWWNGLNATEQLFNTSPSVYAAQVVAGQAGSQTPNGQAAPVNSTVNNPGINPNACPGGLLPDGTCVGAVATGITTQVPVVIYSNPVVNNSPDVILNAVPVTQPATVPTQAQQTTQQASASTGTVTTQSAAVAGPGILDWLGLSSTPTAPIFGSVPNWLLAGGLAALVVFMGGEK